MNKPIKKINIILITILLFPFIFFGLKEIISLNENEKLIQENYKNQLESILFSVNQYSEDLVRSWITKFESIMNNSKDKKELNYSLKKFLAEAYSVKEIYFTNNKSSENSLLIRYINREILFSAKNLQYDSLLSKSQPLLERLIRYSNSGFKKIEPITNNNSLQILVYVTSQSTVCLFAIDKNSFVQRNLSSKIQSIAQDRFIVNITDSTSGNNIYRTENNESKKEVDKALWLIPNYKLGIKLKGETLSDLVASRSKTNLILFISFGVLMLFSAFFAFRNIKKEVELAQIKSDFVSNVSHELRTPLALISMFSETLELGRVKTEEKKNEYYRIISMEANRLSKIVNKILNFSQIEAGKRKYNPSNIIINDTLKKIEDTYSFHLANKGFTYKFDIPKIPIYVKVDEEAIAEAVINLIDNAIKYSKENKFIAVSLILNEKTISIEVEDNGIGIAKEEQPKIFDKFYRASKGLVHNTKGTGLGLSLTKHIVESHNGNIKLESDLDKGSKFSITLPI